MGPPERREVVEAALARMMAHPCEKRPFIVIECSQTHVFVQFRGSRSETLLFDVPLLDRQVDFGLGVTLETIAEASRLAFDVLEALQRSSRQALGLPAGGDIILEESIDDSERERN